MATRSGPRSVILMAASVGALVGLAGCGEDRPSDDEWAQRWERERDAYPSAEEFLEGGEDFCGNLLGQLRVDLDELLPTPDESLDGAVGEWRTHAESIAVECPRDPDELARELDVLDVLAAEVDAGLSAESG
jgi:hypothetical protein